MVPVGAIEKKVIEVCNSADAPAQTIHVFKTPEHFRVEGVTPYRLGSGECQPYILEFQPKLTDTGLTRYGILINDEGQVEMEEYLSRLVVTVEPSDSDGPVADILLGRLSGISLDPEEWIHRIPPLFQQGTYRYQGLIENNNNGYRLIESEFGKMGNFILEQDEVLFSLSNDLPNSLLSEFQWSRNKHSWVKRPNQYTPPEGSCGVALHPAQRWLISGSKFDSTLMSYDRTGIEPLPVKASSHSGRFTKFCNLLFDVTGNTLFSLAFTSQYTGKQTQLIAMRFNTSTGILEDPTYVPLGSDVSFSTLSSLHSMSLDNQNRLAVHPMRSGTKQASIYQYSPNQHSLTLEESLSFDDDEPALRTIDQSRNGQYLLTNSEKVGEFKVKQKLDKQWQTMMLAPWLRFTQDLNEAEFVPVDGRFAHYSDDFVIATRDNNSLRLYTEETPGTQNWRCRQAFFEQEGLPLSAPARKVMYSKDDHWIAVMNDQTILFFQKMSCYTTKNQFFWPKGKPEWWEQYEDKICTTHMREFAHP
ncbi:hypothetical protein [Endozoicomonas numazuensis]|uniref:Uncharacterized protein n=1 Tax=Endozoicomonas numazuensis TaxID=1137799 RepID=A0A081NH11_9GAMM|nr:hypothetical protein [Endozoicomonas numazuensis]KEQ17734.1 hypothetical protein GZ78_08605 [Endozoicomonas numazuensis]